MYAPMRGSTILVAITTRKVGEDIHGRGGKKVDSAKAKCDPKVEFYLPYGEDAELYFLQKILLSQPFTKADHERKFPSSSNVTKTYMEECIHRGLFRGYEEEARET